MRGSNGRALMDKCSYAGHTYLLIFQGRQFRKYQGKRYLIIRDDGLLEISLNFRPKAMRKYVINYVLSANKQRSMSL